MGIGVDGVPQPLTYKWLCDSGKKQEAEKYFKLKNSRVSWERATPTTKRDEILRQYFDTLSYDERLALCDRPEQLEGPSASAWAEINAHLGTRATNLQQLIDQLGHKRFGHKPRVGDAFCGGGSIPFEAARIGCEAYGSDLNPAAALLSWSNINLIGGGEKAKAEIHASQSAAFEAADSQIKQWGIEHNSEGWRADAYLYCVEAICPATGYLLPLAPSWVISEKYNVCAVLEADHKNKRYDMKIKFGADKATIAKAKKGTIQNSRMVCPETNESFSISELRGDRRIDGKTQYGLRLWDKNDLTPLPEDIFQERLYCVRWLEPYWTTNSKGEDVLKYKRHFCSPDENDLNREKKVLEILKSNFAEWQDKGYIPSRVIERGGDKTEEPIRTRGWSHWHQMFAPRQLVVNGLIAKSLDEAATSSAQKAAGLLAVGRCADWNSKMLRWVSHIQKSGGIGGVNQTFSDQALNTLYNYAARSLSDL